ncbi:MAG: hypothetical protein N2508_08505 [Anaerolineae bacterium]|nr:hypothetical protein [Anaerolineae bacterium]
MRLLHLRVEGHYSPEYWLHLEMPAAAVLADLDDFLRAVWLECCGHLSAFTIGKVRYELDTGMVDGMWVDFFGSPYPTRTMDAQLQEVLSVGQTFVHEYDFGTTTVLKLKVVGEREGAPPPGGVRLLARNYAPALSCVQCGKPARWLYVWGGEYEPYCTTHARAHQEWEGGFLPLVNSPRTGECGYTGPADKKLKFEEIRPAEV